MIWVLLGEGWGGGTGPTEPGGQGVGATTGQESKPGPQFPHLSACMWHRAMMPEAQEAQGQNSKGARVAGAV